SEVTAFTTDSLFNDSGAYVGVFQVPNGTTTQNNDRVYRFQGYQIYQVKDATVSPDELNNTDKARPIAQVDIRDGITQLINWEADAEVNQAVPKEKVFGADSGVVHSFRILKDQFSTTDPKLKNFQTYHFMAIAYGYNRYAPYDPATSTGQPYPYLSGRKSPTGSIRSYAGIPHKPSVENGGTVVNAEYGDGFIITRLEGQGNGGNPLAVASSSLNDIVNSSIGRVDQIKYEKGLGPVDIKVVDPLNVALGDFELWLKDTTAVPAANRPNDYPLLQDASWMLVRLSDNPTSDDTVRSTRTIVLPNEQLIPKWGISVSMTQTGYENGARYTAPVRSNKDNTGADWYAGIPDGEGEQVLNWIRSGSATAATSTDTTLKYPDYANVDLGQQYERVLGGTWAPWALVGRNAFQPGSTETAIKNQQIAAVISDIPSVTVVITPDKSKWSRCIVVEESDSAAYTNPANVKKLFLRPRPSVDKNGLTATDPGADVGEANLVDPIGMSWFPGYAVDMETGERLNVFFGENSFTGGGIGRDMLWNPSDKLFSQSGSPMFGGSHWIYVCRNVKRVTSAALANNRMPQYDQCTFARAKMEGNNAAQVAEVYRGVAWVGSALLAEGVQMKTPQEGLVPSEVRLQMSVSKPYNVYGQPFPSYQPEINPVRNGGLPLYAFSTGESTSQTNVTEVGKEGLDLIGVVPNPYYAYSGYETTRLDNRVKFINLPRTCTISIYTVSGTLVRKYRKDNELTYLDWDLKNNYNVPIAGGTYLCHIDAPGLGERVIKWFGVIRPVDLQNF
ncbi:MAG: hypothetical protein ABIQ75_04085, partial [Flavobacteriales bacterium]